MKAMLSFFVDRPGIVNLIMLLVVAAGLGVVSTIPIQGIPRVDLGIYTVITSYPGANAEKVELSITVPLEEELLSVQGVKRVRSNSMESLSLVELSAVPGTSDEQLDLIEEDIQRAIDRARARLPADLLDRPLISRSRADERPTIQFAVTGEASEDLLRSITRNLQTSLRSRHDVYKVERDGYRDKQVRILIDPQKLAQYRISFEEIEQAINRRNVTTTGGSMESFVGEQDIVVMGEFENPEAVADVIIRAEAPGNYLRLRDIAEVVMDYEEWRTRYFYNGKPAILVNVVNSRHTRDIEFVEKLRTWVQDMNSLLPSNVRIEVVSDGTYLTQSLIGSLLSNAMMGMVLIILALLIFFPWRFMIWVVAGIPIAILLALNIVFSMGMIINALTLTSIILMLGLLVDDAIVASESVYRYHELGYSPNRAAVAGLRQVSKPIITGAMTTVLAMTPLLMLSGHDSKFLWYIPATVIFLVIASLLECFFILPSHIAESLKHNRARHPTASWFKKIEAGYRSVLTLYMKRPFRSALVLTAFIFLSLFVISKLLIFKPYPQTDGILINAFVELPAGSSYDATAKVVKELDRQVHQQDAVIEYIESSYAMVGNHTIMPEDVIRGEQSNWGRLVIRLISHNDRSITSMEIADHLNDKLGYSFGEESIRFAPELQSPPLGEAVELTVMAPNDDASLIADEVLTFLKNYEGVTRSWTDYSPGPPSIEVSLNHAKLADYGLKVAEISKTLRVAFDGILVDELQTQDELVRYRLLLQDSYRIDPEAIYSLNVVSREGELVPLRNVADFVTRESQSRIWRFGGRRSETVYAQIDPRGTTVQQINSDLTAFIETAQIYQRYPGASLQFGGEFVAQAASAKTLLIGLFLVLGAIYFLMVLLFNSLTLPFIIMAVIPVSFVAVALIFSLQGIPLSTIATIGFLGLAGVLVNGGLVMIDTIRQLHKERGHEKRYFEREDIVDGAVMRLRPLMITGISTFVGLGPAAYGLGGTDPMSQVMLVVMFWGIAIGSLTNLFTLPIFLVLYSRVRQYFEERKASFAKS